MAIEVDVEADVARVVRSSVTVKLPRDAAFRLFTERMGSWWPLAPTRCSMPRRWR